MTDRITRIAIAGSTVWSAALAKELARAGVDVSFIYTGLGSGMGMGIVRQDSLAKIRLERLRKLHPISSLTYRTVLDYECIDASITSIRLQDAATRILIIDRLTLINTLLADGGIEPHQARQVQPTRDGDELRLRIGRDRELTVDFLLLTGTSDAASAAHVAAGFHPGDLDLITEVGWPDHGTDHAAWMLATGPGVLDGSAMILTSPSGVFVTLRNSMDAVNHASVETHEVIQGLIDHPAFGGILPTTQPGFTANRTTPARPSLSELQFRELVLDLSSVSGFMDPFELDLDLSIGTRLGRQLADIVSGDRLSVARLSSLSRGFKSIDQAHRTVADVMSAQFSPISARQVDALFADLIQSTV